MDLRDLRYFETIAELQHLGRASARLHRTQPALASSIRRLEANCGAALFEKAGPASPRPRGQAALPQRKLHASQAHGRTVSVVPAK